MIDETPRFKAVRLAKAMLKDVPGWDGMVCLDLLPATDEEVLKKGCGVVAKALKDDTTYYLFGC